MNSNNNLVRKPNKEEADFDEEEDIELDDNDEKKSVTHQENAKKRMFKIMGIILAGTAILLLILFIMSLFTNKKYDYDQIEDVLQKAAESYFKDYPDYLPSEDGSVVEVDSSNLVAAGKMKELSEYTGEEVACTGTVQVEKSGSEYLYMPYLNCGDSYTTVELYKKILEDEVVTSGDGLYSNNGSYTYRGEYVDNYVQLDKTLWRVVKVTSDNRLVLISNTGIEESKPWDDRYNESALYDAGINAYKVSRVKEYLDKLYNGTNDDEEILFSNKDRAKMTYHNLCVGKRSPSSDAKDNSLECSDVFKDQKLSLLTLSDYLYASLDPNCVSASTKSCRNYNYLATQFEWWLATGNSDDSSSVFKVDRNGTPKSDTAATYATVRPVIYLSDKTLYKSGKGTLKKPYKVK